MVQAPLLVGALSLAAAPVLSNLLARRPSVEAFGAGLAQVVLVGIVLTQVIPLGLAEAGWLAVPTLVLGLAFAVGAHRLPGGVRAARAAGLAALLVHGVLDGMAFGIGHDHAGQVVAWAVAAHSLPVGLVTWRVGRARGRWAAVGLLALSIAATLAGYAGAAWLHGQLGGQALVLLQCLLAGAILHLAAEWPATGGKSAGVGALAGVAILVATTLDHPIPRLSEGHLDAGRAFLSLVLEAAPAIVVGYLAAGLLHAFAPARLAAWLTGRSALGSAVRGAAVGLPVPVCSCGALPVYRGLLARGAPPPAAMSFLVAGPEIGVGTLLVSLPLLGAPFTALRIAAAIVVAVVVGLLAGRSIATRPGVGDAAEAAAVPPARRLREAARFGLVETVDHTAAWVLLGLMFAALLEPLMAAGLLGGLPAPLAVVGAAAIGVPMYVCASGVTPLVAVLLHKGLGVGAALAFLITGPATNITTFGVLRRLHGPKVATRFAAVVTGAAILLGLAVDAWLPGVALPELHVLSEHAHGPVEWVSAAALVALFAGTLLRQGPRGFVEPVLHPHHDHAHMPGEVHVHGPGACCAVAAPRPSGRSLALAPARPSLVLPVVVERVQRPAPSAAPRDCGGAEPPVE
ncbi:MAG: permease [Deltaproteobacteria bacterium]|nr:permease [Deltaproteobacteria bacterium]